MNAAVFIDRDNTIIANDGDLGDPRQVRLLRGAASAIASLKGLGYRIVVVTNQGGVARGAYGEEDVKAVHERINEMIHGTTGIRVDRFYYCPFHPEGTVKKYKREHPWRKPQPGMLLEAARELELDLSQSWMIGDQLRDIEAGAAAGTRTVLLTATRADAVPPAKRQEEPEQAKTPAAPDFRCPTLTEAVRIIAQQRRPEFHSETPPYDRPRPTRVRQEPPRHAPTPAATATSPQPAPSTAPSTASVDAPTPLPTSTGLPTHTSAPTPASPPGFRPLTAPPASPPRVESRPAAETVPADPDKPAARPAPTADETLRQILAELRSQRDTADEFSLTHIAVLVLISLAVVFFVAGLVTAQGSDGHFLRWLGASIVAQLTAIALLLLRR